MYKYEDFYQILQVHPTAEREIIDSTYKNLAKKYHPDLNKDHDDYMKKINVAYEVLRNETFRKEFHKTWLKHQNSYTYDFEIAKQVLNEYFSNIFNKKYFSAYNLLSDYDKNKISKEDFIKWQSLVGKVFILKQFVVETQSKKNPEIIEFKVTVIEENALTNKIEKDCLTKKTILENGKWRISLGYNELKPIIEKMTELINNKLTDYEDQGFLCKSLFFEKSQLELQRYKRYNCPFSLFILETANIEAAKRLQQKLRTLDLIYKYDSNRFLMLLPETNLLDSLKVVKKMIRLFNNVVDFNIGVTEHNSVLLENSLLRAEKNLLLSKKLGIKTVVSDRGQE